MMASNHGVFPSQITEGCRQTETRCGPIRIMLCSFRKGASSIFVVPTRDRRCGISDYQGLYLMVLSNANMPHHLEFGWQRSSSIATPLISFKPQRNPFY
jgi:hypothetical protein